jgi:hypothetical protein
MILSFLSDRMKGLKSVKKVICRKIVPNSRVNEAQKSLKLLNPQEQMCFYTVSGKSME